jgi:uncharacterized repeat protein (TIGR01451 family)
MEAVKHMKHSCFSSWSYPQGLIAASVLVLGVGTAISGQTLEGQNKGDTTNWTGVNLQGWLELDYIPLRVRFDAGSAGAQVVNIDFPHIVSGRPGLEDLNGFWPATGNAQFTSLPTLSIDSSGVWSYSFTVNIMDQNPAEVRFYTRLAAGAHLYGGSSLQIKGSPGTLQIHKPSPGAGTPDLSVMTTGSTAAVPGGTVSYSISYTNQSLNSIAHGVQVTQILPPQFVLLTNSLPTDAKVTGNTLFWDLGDLGANASGQLSFQGTITLDALPGTILTNLTQILSSENDLNPADNTCSALTTVTCGGVALVIVSDPKSVVACPGSLATFSVAASTSAGLSFQWRKEGTALAGATASSYTIASVTPGDVGLYDVEVSTACGSVVSGAAILSLNPGSRIAINHQSFRPDGGLELQFNTGCSGTYYVQYCADLVSWKTSSQTVIGNGSPASWVDFGPPATDSAPSTSPARFYRVVQAP